MFAFKKYLRFLLFLHCLIGVPQALYAQEASPQPLRVVVDIAPIHDLITQLLEGITIPQLLITGQQSPHLFQLKPSQAQLIQQADMVITVGDHLTPELSQSVERLNPKARHIQLSALPLDEIVPYPEQSAHEHRHNGKDPHIWLDPLLMEQVLDAVGKKLIAAYPQYQGRLEQNYSQLSAKMQRLHSQVSAILSEPSAYSYATYHDAYHYFERRYRLETSLALITSPEDAAGARTSLKRMHKIGETAPACILSESDTPILQRAAEESGAKLVYFDPAYGLKSTPAKHYADLLMGLAAVIKSCQ